MEERHSDRARVTTSANDTATVVCRMHAILVGSLIGRVL